MHSPRLGSAWRFDRAQLALSWPEILNQHQIAAGLVVLIEEDITGIGRNAHSAVERPFCYYCRAVLACGEVEESNESMLAGMRRRPIIYTV
jgi:hypothetical protein